jgi:type IV pilus assembly protein PilW
MKQTMQSGFTLIELLIASFLSLLLFGEIIQIYLSVKTTANLQHAFSQIQENGRFAIYILNQNIRQAGFMHCLEKTDSVTYAIEGYSSENLPNYLTKYAVIPGSDVIVIKKCIKLKSQEQLLTIAFFVIKSARKNSTGEPINSFYMKEMSSNSIHTQELISGISDMKITYGVLTNKKINYMQSKAISDWKQVRSVQISLLLDSINEVLLKPQNYYFRGKQFRPDDRKLYKIWNTYVALRNMV